MKAYTIISLGALTALAVACTAGSSITSGTLGDGGPIDTDSGSKDGSSNVDAGNYPNERAACESYLTCLAAASPSDVTGAIRQYGEDSVCWSGTQNQATACKNACIAETAKQADSSQKAECGYKACPAKDPAASAACNTCIGKACCAQLSLCTDGTSPCSKFLSSIKTNCASAATQAEYDTCVGTQAKANPTGASQQDALAKCVQTNGCAATCQP